MTHSEQSAADTVTNTQSTQAGAVQGESGRQYVPRRAPRDAGSEPVSGPSGAATGFRIAAVLMVISGVWNFLEGLAAVIRGSFFIVLPNYAYDISITGWGWFHLILGVIVAAAGAALLTDLVWARFIGVAVVAASAIVNFLYIPYQRVWSIALIAIDEAIIWALLAPRREYL